MELIKGRADALTELIKSYKKQVSNMQMCVESNHESIARIVKEAVFSGDYERIGLLSEDSKIMLIKIRQLLSVIGDLECVQEELGQ